MATMQVVCDKDISRLADFAIEHGRGLYAPINKPQIEDFLRKHVLYHTLLVVNDGKLIVGMSRWNWIDNETINVLDLIIHPKYRNKKVMKTMLVNTLAIYPWIKRMRFHRKKYNNRETCCLVNNFLGIRTGVRHGKH